MEEFLRKLLWIEVYSNVIGREGESVETALMQANEAVTRYIECWGEPPTPGGR